MNIFLIFRGELVAGVSREQAIQRLASLTKITPDETERRLFKGRPVRIKTVHSQADADRFISTFAKAGFVLHAQQETGSVDRVENSERSSGLRTVGIAALCVLVALLAGVGWYLQPAWRANGTTPELRAVIRALDSDNLVALGHIDVKRTVQLQRRLFGEADSAALPSSAGDGWDSLDSSGIIAGEQIANVLMALHEEDGESNWSIIGLGSPDAAAIRQWISTELLFERFDADTGTIYFTWLDEETCEPVDLMAVRIGPSRVLLTSADRIDSMWSVLDRDISGKGATKDKWLGMAEEQLLTIGIFAPESVGSATDGMAQMMLNAAGQTVAPADGVYFGIVPTLMPPGVDLIGTVSSNDAAFLDQTHGAATTWLETAAASALESTPDLVAMYDRIAISRDEKTIQASVRVDTNLDDEIQNLVSALLQQSFQLPAQDGNRAIEERIDESPQQFSNATIDELPSYLDFGDSFFEPQWQQGPFALSVSKLGFDEDGRLLVSLKGEGRGLPNLGDRSKLVRFRVTDVVTESGESVLPKLECGPIRNTDWSENNAVSQSIYFEGTETVSYPMASLEKELQLAEGVDVDTIAAIRGEIEFLLPTQVRSVNVKSPANGEVVEGSNVRVRLSLQSESEQTINYQVSGDTQRLLDVRGRNAAGQVLESGGAFWSDVWFGSGTNVSADFDGQVAVAEVILADQLEPVRYAFELPGVYPGIDKKDTVLIPTLTVATPSALAAAMRKNTPSVTFDYHEPKSLATADPALLALQRMDKSFFGLSVHLDLYVPQDFPSAYQLNGAAVILDKAVLPDGTSVELGLMAPATLEPDGGYWMNGEFQYDEDRPWLKGSASWQVSEYESEAPTSVSGRVIFRAVRDTAELAIGASPGSQLSEHGVELVVKEWRQNSLSVLIREGAHRIVSVTAIDADGKPAGRAEALTNSDEGTVVQIALTAIPESIHFLLAIEIEEIEKPFSVSIED